MNNTETNETNADAQNTVDAIRILQAAQTRIIRSGESGSRMTIGTLHNAISYLLKGDISAPRGVANLWAQFPVAA